MTSQIWCVLEAFKSLIRACQRAPKHVNPDMNVRDYFFSLFVGVSTPLSALQSSDVAGRELGKPDGER